MKFFTKKEKNPKETNEIENRELKEKLGNAVVGSLKQGIDYEALAYTTIQFGYLFDIEDHGIESLFKVITDQTTLYFAVQGVKMLRLDLTEELYQGTVDTFLALHA